MGPWGSTVTDADCRSRPKIARSGLANTESKTRFFWFNACQCIKSVVYKAAIRQSYPFTEGNVDETIVVLSTLLNLIFQQMFEVVQYCSAYVATAIAARRRHRVFS